MKTLILLHGALGSPAVFDQLIPDLPEDYQIYTFNLSGHGDQPFHKAGFRMEIFATELADFIRLNQLEKPQIFGYSMGGYVALYLEYLQPGTFSKVYTLGTKFAWSPDTAQHEVQRLVPEVIAQKVPAFAQMLAVRHHDWKTLMIATADMMLTLGDNPLLTKEQLASIHTPVLIMRGQHDQMVSEEESALAAAAIPDGVYTELPATPHPIEKVETRILVQLLTDPV